MAKNGGGGGGGPDAAAALKDEGNAHYKSGNFLKAAAVYTQAIKADPNNATLYSNRSAAFLSLLKVTKALADAEMTIKLNPTWEKGYFRKGSALEGGERYEEALAVYREALEKNPKSAEVTTKIKRLTQLVRDKKRSLDKQAPKGDGSKILTGLDQLKLDLSQGAGANVNTEELFNLLKEVVETSLQKWTDTNGKLDPGVRFMVPKGTSSATELVHVTIEKAFESPDTYNNCMSSLQDYANEHKAKAACLVVSKSSIAFPQSAVSILAPIAVGFVVLHISEMMNVVDAVWQGQGSRKWKSSNSNGVFVQLESASLRKLWFIPSVVEKGQNVFRLPELLDLDLHAILPPLFRS